MATKGSTSKASYAVKSYQMKSCLLSQMDVKRKFKTSRNTYNDLTKLNLSPKPELA